MDVARLVLDYIDTLKWVVVVAGLVVYILWRYPGDLARIFAELLQRTRGFSAPGGVRWDLNPPPDQQQAPRPEAPLPPDGGGAETVTINREIGVVENARADDTASVVSREAEGAIEPLLRDYTLARHQLYFEQVYRIIFGSQIALLVALATDPASWKTRSDLEPSYQTFKASSKLDWAFDQYVAFLVQAQLIEQRDGPSYRITQNGQGFLSYLMANGIPLLKPW